MPYLGNVFYLLGLGPPTLFEAYSGLEELIHPAYWFSALLTLLSLAGACLGCGLFVRALCSVFSTLRGQDSATPAALSRALAALCGGVYLGWLLLTGPFLFDRYILPLLPLCWLICLPIAVEEGRLRRWPLVGLLGVSALLSAAGTREYLSWNAA